MLGVQFADISTSCTPTIELSTKNFCSFYTATAPENNVTTYMYTPVYLFIQCHTYCTHVDWFLFSTLFRVSVPRSVLQTSYKVRPHRRRSFDPTDSMGLAKVTQIRHSVHA